ncbi:hypothetical protein AMTRI_Chr10g228190 [Amborella trichopoda]
MVGTEEVALVGGSSTTASTYGGCNATKFRAAATTTMRRQASQRTSTSFPDKLNCQMPTWDSHTLQPSLHQLGTHGCLALLAAYRPSTTTYSYWVQQVVGIYYGFACSSTTMIWCSGTTMPDLVATTRLVNY